MRQKTVLDHVHPTVVVRRRIYDATLFREEAPKVVVAPVVAGEDEDGPPSSVNVARALASLRADELQRVEELIGAQEEEEDVQAAEAAAQAALVAISVPTIRAGREIALAELATRMKVSRDELVTALVTGGFFSVSAKSVLPRQTARAAAEMFGWRIVDDDTLDLITAKSPKRARAPVPVVTAKAKPKASAAKPRTARTTKRGK